MSGKQVSSVAMTTSFDLWTRELSEASQLAEDIDAMISERASLPPSGLGMQVKQRHLTEIRRKLAILRRKLEGMESLLTKLQSEQSIKDIELHERQAILSNLKSKADDMSSTINVPNFTNREDLFEDSNKRSSDVITRISGLDSQGILGLQNQIMKEQDEGLEKLEEALLSSKHIALAVNEELDLHARLIYDLDQHVDVTDSMLQRVRKRLGKINRRTEGGCSCICLLGSVMAIVILMVVLWVLINYS